MRKSSIEIRLEPLGKTIHVESGASLKNVLWDFGVEFPCGGEGLCKRCLVKVVSGNLELNDVQRQKLTKEEIENGFRLACQCRIFESATLELSQFETSILSDEIGIQVKPADGLGVAIDLGTTTLVAQLLDLRNGNILGVRSALNPQAQHGADIMSRINFALKESGAAILQRLIREKLGVMICELLSVSNLSLKKIVIVGNTAMHHLFNGIDVLPLSRYPFQPERDGEFVWKASDLGWDLRDDPKIVFLSCLGGFVGSDLLAGILAVGMSESEDTIGLIDLGTNGEVVIGNKSRILCSSTAAGPAFEGAKISQGMRASTGAISKVKIRDGKMAYEIIGNGSPKGICGSGLVDAVACELKLGQIASSGRLSDSRKVLELIPPVSITQNDIRELQLAKAAIAAGVEILLKRMALQKSDLRKVHLAGAFGNYINLTGAKRIGLLNFDDSVLIQSGNTALRGAKLALFRDDNYDEILRKVEHVPLAADPEFQDIFVDQMNFPPTVYR
ncbi:MAG: ASKHA domain-containing protein [Candidatus Marinimicrobia bacterium]|nr:ASKHA domain-containing protein [Candidatus Neomarinimicrobiota bacterium]